MARGYPDYSRPTYPARTSILEGQTRFNLRAVIPVDASDTATGDLYTVPTGKRLIIGYAKLSCSHSCIQQADLLLDDDEFASLYFDLLLVVPLSDIAGWVFEAGEVLSAKLYNNLAEDVTFIGVFVGFLQDA